MVKILSDIFSFAIDYRTMASEWQRETLFQEIRTGSRFKTGHFVEEKLGGLPPNDTLVCLRCVSQPRISSSKEELVSL